MVVSSTTLCYLPKPVRAYDIAAGAVEETIALAQPYWQTGRRFWQSLVVMMHSFNYVGR